MLTGLEQLPLRRSTFGHRPNSVIPHSLPDSQVILELTLREIETTITGAQNQLQSLPPQFSPEAPCEPNVVDQVRHGLCSVSAEYLNHLKAIRERIVSRHHPEGKSGPIIARLRDELSGQIERLLIDQQQLGELSAVQ